MAEKKPIIKVYLWRPREAWLRLSDEERKELNDKVEKNLEQVGGKTIVTCMSYWSDEEWVMFGVEEFPDIEAVQEHAQFLVETYNSLRYSEAKTYLGTRWP